MCMKFMFVLCGCEQRKKKNKHRINFNDVCIFSWKTAFKKKKKRRKTEYFNWRRMVSRQPFEERLREQARPLVGN